MPLKPATGLKLFSCGGIVGGAEYSECGGQHAKHRQHGSQFGIVLHLHSPFTEFFYFLVKFESGYSQPENGLASAATNPLVNNTATANPALINKS